MTDFLAQLIQGIASSAIYDLFKKLRIPTQRIESKKLKALAPDNQITLVPAIVIPDPTRLKISLDRINQGRNYSDRITISEVAEACGVEEDLMEKYFTGELVAPFSVKRKYCNAYNVNSKWVLHGKEESFSHFLCREFTDVHNSAYFISQFLPEKIYFIKTKSERAPFCLVLKRGDEYAIVNFEGNWLISDETGRGGQRQTTSLYVLLKWLNKGTYVDFFERGKEKRFGVRSCFRGVELENDHEFYDLIAGKSHPNFLDNHITRNCTSYWWDDFTDIEHSFFSKEQYINMYGAQFVKAQEVVKYTIAEDNSYFPLLKAS